jgi:2-iminobutanoate/2-iminopropanoate deaminase
MPTSTSNIMPVQHHIIPGAPDPVAPFSHVVEADGWVYLTGQMLFSGTSIHEPYPPGIEAQTHQVMHNLQTVLSGVSLDLAQVVQVRVYLLHFERDYDAMNAVYATYFAPNQRPARTCVGVSGLAKGALIEVDMVARRL